MSDPISAYVCADCTVANFSKDNCINCGSTNVVDRPPVAASEEPEAGDPWSIIKPFLSLKLDEIRDDDHLRVIQAAMRFLDVTPTPAEPEKPRNWKHNCEDWAMEGDACARCSPYAEPEGARDHEAMETLRSASLKKGWKWQWDGMDLQQVTLGPDAADTYKDPADAVLTERKEGES